jgi:hypothetical protein
MPRKPKDDDFAFAFEEPEDDEEDEEGLDEDELAELEEYMGDFPELDYIDEIEFLDDDEDFYSTK